MSERVLTRGGFCSFKDFIEDKSTVYVDKTGYACRLGKHLGSFILTRPRRMGKTTLVSTLEYLFSQGTKGTEGLECFDAWQETERYFVFKFNWNTVNVTSLDEFKAGILDSFERYAKYFGVTLPPSSSLSFAFKTLIKESLKKLSDPAFLADHTELTEGDMPLCTHEPVVLIDEYDAPMTHAFGNDEMVQAILKEYRMLFAGMKGIDLRFVLLTGVTTFSLASIFSGANQFRNISLDEEYAACCGYTLGELERYFEPELNHAQEVLGLAREELLDKISRHYGGYLFAEENNKDDMVCSPVSVSRFLCKPRKGFYPHWSTTGGDSGFLYKLLQACSIFVAEHQADILHPDFYKLPNEQKDMIIDKIKASVPAAKLAVDTDDLTRDNPNLLPYAHDNLLTLDLELDLFNPHTATQILFHAGYLAIKDVAKRTDFLENSLLGLANLDVAHTLASLLEDKPDNE